MIEQLPRASTKVLGFKLSGKLHDEDYKSFVPLVDKAIAEQGKVRMLAMFHDFHGWDMHALWDDIKFSTTHCKIEHALPVATRNGKSGWPRFANRSRWPRSNTSKPPMLSQPGSGWKADDKPAFLRPLRWDVARWDSIRLRLTLLTQCNLPRDMLPSLSPYFTWT